MKNSNKQRDVLTPEEDQSRASDVLGYGGIHLARVGDRAIVTVQVGELWVPVISEFYDDCFSHTTYPLGIEHDVALFFAKRQSLFEFTSHQHWVNKATRLFPESGHTSADSICIDNDGRVVKSGNGFMRAEREGTYPIRVYSTREDA